MSSTPTAPTTPPTSTAATDATPRASEAAPPAPAASTSFRQWLRNLSPAAKGAFVVVLILLAVAWYIITGRVSTDDAQVDCHITAVAPQVPGYVVQLFINDNTPVKEGDPMVQIDARPYEAEVEQAKANLDFAEAQANSAKLQITLTRETTTHNTGGATLRKNPTQPITQVHRLNSSRPRRPISKWLRPTSLRRKLPMIGHKAI